MILYKEKKSMDTHFWRFMVLKDGNSYNKTKKQDVCTTLFWSNFAFLSEKIDQPKIKSVFLKNLQNPNFHNFWNTSAHG